MGFLLAAATLAGSLACGPGSAADAGPAADAAPLADAGSDGMADSGPPFPECPEDFHDLPWLDVRFAGHDRADVEYAMTVVESSETRIRAEDGGLPADRADPYVQIDFPRPMGAEFALPRVGDPLLMLGGSCNIKQDIYYVRLTTPDRELLFEGGSPDCGDMEAEYWNPTPYLGARDRAGAEPCSEVLESCCCRDRTEHDVILHPDGDSVLVRGQDREVEIDGARFLASSQGIFLLEVTPCTMLHSTVKGSAFLLRMAD